jgi:hypothetical protein
MSPASGRPLETLPEGRRRLDGSRKPWPRPPVPGQEGKSPTVTDVPLLTELEFQRAIGTRLVAVTAVGWVRPLARAVARPYPDHLDDRTILDLLFDTVFCRFLTFTLSAEDHHVFAPFLDDRRPDATDFKVDFSAVARIHARPGIYVAPTVTLGRIEPDGRPRLVAMHISGMTLTPADANAWALARYFLMQGAGLHALLVHHTPLHFALDAINAVTMSLLPPDHTLRRLLAPHFQFTLSLNRAALHSRLSILTGHPLLPYATLPGDAASNHHFQATGWSGIEGNDAYPAYRFPRRPPPVHGPLGAFLDRYHEVIRRFAGQVTATIREDDPQVLAWADAVSAWVPGFPSGAEIRRPDVLADVAASIVWSATVTHSAEHHGLVEDIPLASIPLRLRVPPPVSRDVPPVDRRRLTTAGDIFRQRMAWKLLVGPRATTRLADCRYAFADPALRRANADFLAALRDVDAHPGMRRFVPLDRIARSIQA